MPGGNYTNIYGGAAKGCRTERAGATAIHVIKEKAWIDSMKLKLGPISRKISYVT